MQPFKFPEYFFSISQSQPTGAYWRVSYIIKKGDETKGSGALPELTVPELNRLTLTILTRPGAPEVHPETLVKLVFPEAVCKLDPIADDFEILRGSTILDRGNDRYTAWANAWAHLKAVNLA